MTYLQKLRAAQAEVNAQKARELAIRNEAEAQRRKIEGENLTEILNFLGFELKEPLPQNEYKVDEFTFSYQSYSGGYGDFKGGYRKNDSGELTFRLVVVKDTPFDELVEDFHWGCSGDVVGRDIDANNMDSQTIWRADLADLLDAINQEYYSRLPLYEAALEQARQRQTQQPQAEPEYPQTFLYLHDHTRRDNDELTDLIQRGYRVVAMNTISDDDGEAMSYILLSRHPNPLPITLQYHEEV